MSQLAIQTGRVYWIRLGGVRERVRAVQASRGALWLCIASTGTEISVPEADFLGECPEVWDGWRMVSAERPAAPEGPAP